MGDEAANAVVRTGEGVQATCVAPSIRKRDLSIRDFVLFAYALRLARMAQGVRVSPIPNVAARLCAAWPRPPKLTTRQALVAATRGCRYHTRWCGGLDTCLVRSLVAGALLREHPGVELVIGFRPASMTLTGIDGHAWLRVSGNVVDVGGVRDLSDTAYSELLVVKMQVEKKEYSDHEPDKVSRAAG